MSHQANRKNTITNCLMSPVCHSGTLFHLGSAHELGHWLEYVFPPSRLDLGPCPAGRRTLVWGMREGKERRETHEQHFKKKKKEEGSPSCFVRGGLLTWGNICCVEIETDDSNYMQSEGPASLDGKCNGRGEDRPHPFDPLAQKVSGLQTYRI